jgi:RNA polymerase sigma-70 factor (sigma-E family)
MTTTGKDTGTTREETLLAHVYQQAIDAQAERYAAAYDAAAGLKRFTDWLQHHTAADLDADQALTQLYLMHYQSLVQLATLLVRDTATAEEVVQDAFVAMHGGWARLRDPDHALAYLRQAVVNRSRSVLRHRTVTGTNLPPAQPDTPSAEHADHGLLALPAARAALRSLPSRQREAIVLRYYSDLSEEQIAAAMGISRGAVKSHTARGLASLRAAVEQATSQPVSPEDSGHEPSNP